MRTTIDFGIDLGTTNSSIAVLNGMDLKVFKNSDQYECTPSAVYVDRKDRLYVGRLAYVHLDDDQQNAYGEFKLQMGTDREYVFTRSGRRMKPHELSSEVLKSLRADVMVSSGEDVRAAVITVPAAFELPQCDATQRAAKLAGFETSSLLQEPVAAAMAYGFGKESGRAFWFVYDFGGGTFDAAVIQLSDGSIQVVNHKGNNHLGGKNLDWAIVEQLLVPALLKEFRLIGFERGEEKWAGAFAKLKIAAEQAKIRLSRAASTPITIDNLCTSDAGVNVDFEYELQRADVERLAGEFIRKTVELSRQAMAEKRLHPGDMQKLLLVGGPTLMPFLRESLSDPKEGLGIPLEMGIDPMTVVARGAAIHAASQRLNLRPAMRPGMFALDLDYKPVGRDPEPLIGGRVSSETTADLSGCTIEFVNTSIYPPWRSGKIGLSENGGFTSQLFAENGAENTFQIEVKDSTGAVVKTGSDLITYRFGIDTVTEQPLLNSVGVALANNEMELFFSKGTSLPARKRWTGKAVLGVKKDDPKSELRIPIVEGENERRADRNIRIGALVIRSSDVKRDIPADSDVEVKLDIDESRVIRAEAYIPVLDQEFEGVIDQGREHKDLDSMRTELEVQKARLKKIQADLEKVGDESSRAAVRHIEATGMIRDVENALGAWTGDPDAPDRCQKSLVTLKMAIDSVADRTELPTLIVRANEFIGKLESVAKRWGNDQDRAQAAAIIRELRRAIEIGDPDLVRARSSSVEGHRMIILRQDKDVVMAWINTDAAKIDQMKDRAAARQAIEDGGRAFRAGDLIALNAASDRLTDLLPTDLQETRRDGFGSGVGR